MMSFNPPSSITLAFWVLSVFVALQALAMVLRAAPREKRWTWGGLALTGIVLWMGLHWGIATSGILEGTSLPPPVAPYLLGNVSVALLVAFSPLGRRLAALPIALLIATQVFRLPLEMLLHALYDAGALPRQITWSGLNYDVLTAILAVPLALWAWKGAPRWALWGWNILGSIFLITVVAIAVLSGPFPFRQFHEGPPVLLAFVTPYNWIVNVHVFSAMVGHLVIYRALLRPSNAQA